MRFFARLVFACGITILSVAALSAASVTYDYSFGGINAGDTTLGTSVSVLPNGFTTPSITAYGFSGLNGVNSVGAKDLYSKGGAFNFTNPASASNGEVGLGISSDSDHEIAGSDFVVLDISKLIGGAISSIDLYFESTTNGESFSLWGSNTMPTVGGSTWTPSKGVTIGNKNGAVDISSLEGDKYLYITANGDSNVLIGGLSLVDPAPAPEPAYTAGLGGTLLLGGLFLRRRLSAAGATKFRLPRTPF